MKQSHIIYVLIILIAIGLIIWYYRSRKNSTGMGLFTTANSQTGVNSNSQIRTIGPNTATLSNVQILETSQVEAEAITNVIIQSINSWIAGTNNPNISIPSGIDNAKASCIAVATYGVINWMYAQPNHTVQPGTQLPLDQISNPMIGCYSGMTRKKADCIANTIFNMIKETWIKGNSTSNIDSVAYATNLVNCSNS